MLIGSLIAALVAPLRALKPPRSPADGPVMLFRGKEAAAVTTRLVNNGSRSPD